MSGGNDSVPVCTCPSGFDGGRGWSSTCAVHANEFDHLSRPPEHVQLHQNERLLLIYLLSNVVSYDKRGSCNIMNFCAEKNIDLSALKRKIEASIGIGG